MKDDAVTDDVIDEIDHEERITQPTAPPANVPATVKADAPAATAERMVNPFAIFRQRNSSGAVLFRGDLIKCDHNTGEWLRRATIRQMWRGRRWHPPQVPPNLAATRSRAQETTQCRSEPHPPAHVRD
jgi:hypothetical protein